MIISISGLPGSGKSTVAKIISARLGLERIYMGGILRKLAEQKGVSILQLMKQAETDSTIDEEADRYVSELGRNKDNFLIESRTAFHFIPNSFKIFIKVEAKEGARRIYQDLKKEERKNEEKASSEEELAKKLRERVEIDRKRYEKYYGIDFTNENNYDLVINSTYLSPEEVAEKILKAVEKAKEEEEN